MLLTVEGPTGDQGRLLGVALHTHETRGQVDTHVRLGGLHLPAVQVPRAQSTLMGAPVLMVKATITKAAVKVKLILLLVWLSTTTVHFLGFTSLVHYGLYNS